MYNVCMVIEKFLHLFVENKNAQNYQNLFINFMKIYKSWNIHVEIKEIYSLSSRKYSNYLHKRLIRNETRNQTFGSSCM